MKSSLNIYRFLKKEEIKKCFRLNTSLILLITIFQLSGCSQELISVSSDPTSQNKNTIADTELERNRRLWRESKIVNYNFVSSRYQGGMYFWIPVLIQVRNGKAISMEPTRERAELVKIEGYEDFDTIEKIFDKIHESYDNGDKVTVTYNKELGYPESTNIDPKNGGMDTQFTIVVSNFEVIKTD